MKAAVLRKGVLAGVGEMAQMVKYLMYQPESLIMLLSAHVKTISECAGKQF